MDTDLAEKKVTRADFYVYGGCLVAHTQATLIHAYLYANLAEMMDLKDLEDVGTKQTLVIQDQGVIKEDKKHKMFSPEDLQAIIRFVNKNSKTFRCSDSKQS